MFSPAILLICYLVMINLAGLLSMGIDKHKARARRWRIPEKTLLLIAVLGGSAGSIAGMLLFHHKTRHPAFSIGLPLILLLQAVAVFLICKISVRFPFTLL